MLRVNLPTIMLSVGFLAFSVDAFAQQGKYQIKIEKTDAGTALTSLGLQTSHPLLFDFNQVKSIKVNALEGKYTLQEALDLILEGSGLSGSLSEREVITISLKPKSETQSKDDEMNFKGKKSLISSVSAAVLSTFAAPALAQTVLNDDGAIMDEVVATGIRASLDRGSAIKRNADGVVDAITAEEFGKFPDANVAESLQRITGVAITRARGGEGRFVTVRGLGEEFNNVTYNGRTLATENLGREFSFDVLASELISRAEVYKSSEARLNDGSIGGLINVATAKPLTNPGFHASGSIAAEQDNLADSTGFRASGVISNSFANDTVGVLASLTMHKRDLRSDTYESIDYRTLDLVNRGGGSATSGLSVFNAGAGDTAADIVSTAVSSTYSAGINREERERLGGTLALQFQPSDDLDITADLLYTQYQSPGESSFTTAYFPGLRDGSISVANNYITGWTGDFTSDIVGRSFQSDTDTLQLGLNADWDASDRLRFNADAAWSKAEGRRDNNGSDAGGGNFLVLGIPGSVAQFEELGRVDRLSVQVPNYDPAGVGSAPGLDGNPVVGGPGTGLVDISQSDPRLLNAHFNRVSEFTVADEVLSLRLNSEYDINDSTYLSFGVDFTDREKENNLFLNSAGQIEFCCYAANFQSLNPAAFTGFTAPISDSFINSNVPQGFLGFSSAGFRDYFSNLRVGQFGQLGLGLNAGTALTNTPVLEPLFQDAASNIVQEQILGGFAQVNFGGEISDLPYEANVGVRVVKTDLTSIGAQAQIQSIAVGTDQTSQQFNLTAPQPVSIDGSYTNFLPSANIKLDLTDNLIMRAAASKTISRPTLTDVSTRFAVTSQNIGTETISQGNPGLEAPESTNFDVSFEYYGDNGLSANAAVFHKNIDGFVANRRVDQVINFTELNPGNLPANLTAGTRTVDSLQPTNAETAEVTGLELAGQYIHDSGFGAQVNLTLVESEATFNGASAKLENVSPVSYNLSGFYENDRLSARLSYNFREGYLQTTQGLQGRSEFTDDYGQLDFSASFNINDNFSVFAEGINLTEEASYTYSEQFEIIRNYEENGRRLLLGVRGNF